MNSRLRSGLTGLVVAALVAAGAVLGQVPPATAAVSAGPAPIEQRNAQLVSNDVLPTVQIESGIVWAQVINGDTVYAGGKFDAARPANAAPGVGTMPRGNILAYNINTGVATDFAPMINGTVKSLALSPDGSRLYVGGTFTRVTVNGVESIRHNLAAFDTATGALVTTFQPAIGGSYVNAIVATADTVYVGGLIGAATGVSRKNLAAVSTTGQLLAWAPTADLQVDTMLMNNSRTKLIVGGRFANVNGSPARGLAALDPATGSMVPWAITSVVVNGMSSGTYTGKAGISTLTSDASGAVYGTGWSFAPAAVANLEGIFSANGDTGATNWIADCHGDHYGVYSDGTNVYSTSHEHDCSTAGGFPQAAGNPGNMRNATVYTTATKGTLTRSPSAGTGYADWNGFPAPAAVNWYPDWTTGTASGMGQAGWTVTGNGKYVVFGGEFPYVNGKRAQGIVRFAVTPQGEAKDGPRLSGANWTATATAIGNAARISFPANHDRDDLNLTYEVWENGATAPAATSGVVASTFWNRPAQLIWVRGLAPGSTHTYTVVARDGDGNIARSAEMTVTVGIAAASAYADMVVQDGASLYWRLGSPSAVGGADIIGGNDAVFGTSASTSSSSAISGDLGGSASFSGTSSSMARSKNVVTVGNTFAMETWFRTNSFFGGEIANRGSAASGASPSNDRHLYVTNSGNVVFGVYDGTARTIQSPKTYRDNAWHHVVAQLSPRGMELYVDGAKVATNASVTTAEATPGYWRLGGDNLSGWPSKPTSTAFSGQIDEFAVYDAALSDNQVASHYGMGTGIGVPTAQFTATGDDVTKTFDASASTAAAGRTIASYAWDFGDGGSGTGVNPAHTYAAAGTYTVALTVTDDVGLTAKRITNVNVVALHHPPVAAIMAQATGLTAALTSAGTTTSSGATITAHAWDFGDGTTSTEATPSHRYGAAGTYTVTLVVTDSMGVASAAATFAVTVTHADPVASFTANASALSVATDASASTASDGATLSYAWNWGDGSVDDAGKNATHVYAASGDYVITLTATDALGASNVTTRTVQVSDQTYAARDDFDRTLTSGWGSATIGGAWSGATGQSVSDGVGKLTVAKSQTKSMYLTSVSVADQDLTAIVAADKVADGGGLHTNLVAHRTADGEYRLKVRTSAAGVVTVSLNKLVGTTETAIGTAKVLTGVTYAAGDRLALHLRTRTVGGTTTLNANVWRAGDAEPSGWVLSGTDATAQLQGPGQVGFVAYGTGTITNGPITVSLDSLAAVSTAPVVVHAAPVAVIGQTANARSVAFTAAGSTTSDNATLTGYAWSFGDGTTSTEAAPTHEYATAGTYAVTLKVTDSLGATSAVATGSVTVSDAPPAPPTASFTSAVTALQVAVDGSASTGSGALTYAWNWGDGSADGAGVTGTHDYAVAGTYPVTLTVTDALGATATSTASVTVATAGIPPLAADDFSRTTTSGWGQAQTGGTWTATTGLSVSDGLGRISLTKSATRGATLPGVQAADVNMTATLGTDKLADGGGLHLNLSAHQSSAGEYRAKARIAATGVVQISLAKVIGTTETLVANTTLAGYTHAAGQSLQFRFQTATVGGVTQLKVKAWPAGTAEPDAWTVTANDSTAELQAPGAVGIGAYLSGTVTVAPVVVSVDDVTVR